MEHGGERADISSLFLLQNTLRDFMRNFGAGIIEISAMLELLMGSSRW